MIEFETDIPSEEILKGGGGGWPAPGVYHMQVDHADEHESEGFIQLKTSILSPGTETGKTLERRVYFRGKTDESTVTCRRITLATAIRLGLTTQAAYDADKQAGRNHGVEWVNCVGNQFIGEIKSENYTRNDGSAGQKAVLDSIYPIDEARATKRVLDGVGFDLDLLSLVLPGGPVTAAPTVAKNPPANAPSQAKAPPTPPSQATQPQQQQTTTAAAKTLPIYDDI